MKEKNKPKTLTSNLKFLSVLGFFKSLLKNKSWGGNVSSAHKMWR